MFVKLHELVKSKLLFIDEIILAIKFDLSQRWQCNILHTDAGEFLLFIIHCVNIVPELFVQASIQNNCESQT